MLGWFRALMPKDDRFFDLFARHSRTLVQGAAALEKLLQAGDAMQEHAVEIATREQEADEITREVLLAVRRIRSSSWSCCMDGCGPSKGRRIEHLVMRYIGSGDSSASRSPSDARPVP